jgi:Cft2 family RNA processing exonuclease
MDPETPGYVIANAEKGDDIEITGISEKVKCEIKNFKFSAHARREGLLKLVDLLSPDNVILLHGDDEAIDWIGKSILSKKRNTRLFKAQKGKEIIFT